MRKKLAIWFGALLLLVCFVTGCEKSLEQQIAEQLESGQKYLTELNYEEAIVAFTKAIELDEKNVDAYIGRGQVYEAMAQAAGEESTDGKAYYKQAAGEYEQALSLSSEKSFLYDRLLTIYQITENLEELEKLTEMEQSGITDKKLLEHIKNIKTVLETIEKISNGCEAGEIDQVFELMKSDEFEILEQFIRETKHPIRQVKNGKGVGIYLPQGFTEFSGCMIYYGNYQDGLRHGHGVWLGYDYPYHYQAEGEWHNDIPNGSQEDIEWTDDRNECDRMVSVVENGLWHGAAVCVIEEGNEKEEYPLSFENGKYTVLSQDEENGTTWYTVSEIVGPDGRPRYLVILDPDELVGIMGFES